ncbi:MAG TPA: aldo/keto reductase [Actinomycetes bacterium]|nr:aldo/keto reductase [Actinomycetes bacterium]
MRFRPLGDSGLIVSVVGVGCNNFGRRIDRDASHKVVHAAVDAGVTLFDTADTYGTPHGASEELLGEALGSRRDDVIVATKFGSDMEGVNGRDFGARGSRRYVQIAIEASLRRLRTDRIDLLQMHEPDPITPIEETLSALDDLVHAGKVRYLGSSNVSGWQIADAEWTARTSGFERFVSVQNEYSLLERGIEDEVIPACEEYGIGVLPYFPLAQGLLTGKYPRGEQPTTGRLRNRVHLVENANHDAIEGLQDYARELGIDILDLAIGGLAAQPAVASVIAGASTPEQVNANVAAGLWEPTAADLARIDDITGRDRKKES